MSLVYSLASDVVCVYLFFFNGLFQGELCIEIENWRVDALERRFKYTMFGSRVVRQLT